RIGNYSTQANGRLEWGTVRLRVPRNQISLLPDSLHVAAVLVKHEICDFALVVLKELQLGFYDFQKELRIGLREKREFRLVGSLRHELPIFQGHYDVEPGHQLIGSDVL